MYDINKINDFLQSKLAEKGIKEVTAVEAASWLDSEGILKDNPKRPGLPLRNMLRNNKIIGQYQLPDRPYGKWFIKNVSL